MDPTAIIDHGDDAAATVDEDLRRQQCPSHPPTPSGEGQ